MSTKKANKPTRKKMENKQEVTALPSKRELTEAIVTLEQKINQVYASLSMVSNNLIFVLDKLTQETPVAPETDYSQEYLSTNVRHMFSNMYYDDEKKEFIRLTPIVEGWENTVEGETYTFEKEGEATYIIDAKSEIEALKGLRTKLRANVTFEPKHTLEVVEEKVTETEEASS
jgi:hypothetical protein